MIRHTLPVLLAVLLASILTASAEDKPEFPPLHSWTEIEDMTDKVIEWDVPAGKVETYSLLDPIPPLPEPGPVCKAPPELDSFADGTGIPVQLGIGREPPKAGMSAFIGLRQSLDYSVGQFWSMALRKLSDLPAAQWSKPRRTDPLLLSPEARKAFDSKMAELGKIAWCNKVLVGPGNFFVVLMQSDDHYGIRKTRSVYDLVLSPDGTIQTKEIPDFTDCDFIEAFQWREGCGKKGAAVFLDDKGSLRILQADGTVLEQPFCFKPTMGTDVWNPPRDFFGGTDAIAFPSLAVFERNYGIPRNSIVPLMMDPEGGFTRPEYKKWENEAPLKPDVPRSRVVLQDLTTSQVFLDKEGIFDLWPLGSDTFMYPCVASKGEWNFALINRTGLVRLLPYSSFFPAFEFCCESANSGFVAASDRVISVFSLFERKATRILPFRPHDVVTFKSLGLYGLGISTPYTIEGKQVRQVWKFDTRGGVLEYSFVMEDVFHPSEGQCSLRPYGDNLLVISVGDKYGRISLRRAE